MPISKDSIYRALRTFGVAFAVIFIPGILGWLGDLTSWASSNGQTAFPDLGALEYLGVSAITAGFIAIVNLIWNAIEDGTGTGILRIPNSTLVAGHTAAGAGLLPAAQDVSPVGTIKIPVVVDADAAHAALDELGAHADQVAQKVAAATTPADPTPTSPKAKQPSMAAKKRAAAK